MQYVFSMTSRMVTIAITSAVVLCILLFLMGVEIGARLTRAPLSPAADAHAVVPSVFAPATSSAAPVQAAPDAGGDAPAPASSTP